MKRVVAIGHRIADGGFEVRTLAGWEYWPPLPTPRGNRALLTYTAPPHTRRTYGPDRIA